MRAKVGPSFVPKLAPGKRGVKRGSQRFRKEALWRDSVPLLSHRTPSFRQRAVPALEGFTLSTTYDDDASPYRLDEAERIPATLPVPNATPKLTTSATMLRMEDILATSFCN